MSLQRPLKYSGVTRAFILDELQALGEMPSAAELLEHSLKWRQGVRALAFSIQESKVEYVQTGPEIVCGFSRVTGLLENGDEGRATLARLRIWLLTGDHLGEYGK